MITATALYHDGTFGENPKANLTEALVCVNQWSCQEGSGNITITLSLKEVIPKLAWKFIKPNIHAYI